MVLKVFMENCIVICDSGNFCVKLSDLLAKEGYYSEVTSTPCKLSVGGCSYSVKFSCGIRDKVREIAGKNKINLKAAYRIEPQLLKNNYVLL